MRFEELKRLYENEVVTEAQFEEIEQGEDITKVENNGNSGNHYNKVWYTAYSNEDEFDFYN